MNNTNNLLKKIQTMQKNAFDNLLKCIDDCNQLDVLENETYKNQILTKLKIPTSIITICPACDYDFTTSDETKESNDIIETNSIEVPQKSDIIKNKLVPKSFVLDYLISIQAITNNPNPDKPSRDGTIQNLKNRIKEETGFTVKERELEEGKLVFVEQGVRIDDDSTLLASSAKFVQAERKNEKIQIRQEQMFAYQKTMISVYLADIIQYVLNLSSAEVFVLKKIFSVEDPSTSNAYISFRRYLTQTATGYVASIKLGLIRNISLNELEFERFNQTKLISAYKMTSMSEVDDNNQTQIHTRFQNETDK